jgi:hypothetical protein
VMRQPRQEAPQRVQQQSAPAPKHEGGEKHGPPAQPAAQSQGGGKGKDKKP